MWWVHRTPSSGNPGIWWPTLAHNVEEYVGTCSTYAQSWTSRQLPTEPLPIPKPPWSHMAVDFITDFPNQAGLTMILIAIDRFSKACRLIPLKALPTAMETAITLFHHVLHPSGD